MTIRTGELDGFKAQAAELVRLTDEHDTRTLRYDWYVKEDGTECEVHEEYLDERGLFEHNAHITDARSVLFERYADGHHMSIYGDVSQQLRDLAVTHAGGVNVFALLQGLRATTATE